MPSRSLAVDYTFSITANPDISGSVAVDIGVAGQNGLVAVQGSTTVPAQGTPSGQYTAKVNGSVFATITTTATPRR